MIKYYEHTCKCGCGGLIEVKPHHKYYGIPKFIQGHHTLKHDGTGTKLFWVWSGMKQRCLNPNCKKYKDYGERGIKICEEWLDKENGFINFRTWSLANGYVEGLIFDRIDPNGNYEPNNCRFLTVEESLRNKTNTITMQIANEIRDLAKTGKYTQQELAKMFGVSRATISHIINNKRWKNK